MNARFWDWINGDWVKITLKPGQLIRSRSYRRNEEGWDLLEQAWCLCSDGFVRNSWRFQSKDCNGRYDSGGGMQCHVMRLKQKDQYEIAPCASHRGILTPDWRGLKGSHWQRDHSAEAA